MRKTNNVDYVGGCVDPGPAAGTAFQPNATQGRCFPFLFFFWLSVIYWSHQNSGATRMSYSHTGQAAECRIRNALD